MAGLINQKSQQIDSFTGKYFKGNYREYYCRYMPTVLVNENLFSKPPTHQRFA